jgi:hypothetical protein
MLRWVFASPTRLHVTIAATVAVLTLLFVSATAWRVSQVVGPDATLVEALAQPSASPAPTPVETAPGPTFATPEPSLAPPAENTRLVQVAEAVVTDWIYGAPSVHAEVGLVHLMHEDPLTGEEITGDATAVLVGDVVARVEVPTSAGVVQVDLRFIEDRWVARGVEVL